MTLDLRAEVEIWPFRACVMHPATYYSWFTVDLATTERISIWPTSTKPVCVNIEVKQT